MKIIFTIFCMPQDIDELERVIVDINKCLRYVDSEKYGFYVSLGLSDYLVDWKNSRLDKEFFVDKFNNLKKLTDWSKNSIFQIRSDIIGAMDNKRAAHKECTDATHFIWIDTDICFDEKILFFIESSIKEIQNTNSENYFITPEIVRYWDQTWDCIVNEKFMQMELDYCKNNNPFKDSGQVDDVSLERVLNNIPGQPKTKFGAGWFTCITKKLLDLRPIPESMGSYGPDDTFLMWCYEKLNSRGEVILQFKLKNYVVCENYKYRNNIYKKYIHLIDRKEEFKKIANDSFIEEYSKI